MIKYIIGIFVGIWLLGSIYLEFKGMEDDYVDDEYNEYY